ncbi:MAG: hypothetical protein ACLQIB_45300 [Isosphaeraceae bacterium]
METIPLAGEEERATTAIEMLSPDQGPMPVARSAQRERRDAMAPATPRAPAPVPQAPKKLPLSGEPLPFHRSRKLMAIVASIMVLGAGVAFIIWYVGQLRVLDRTVVAAADQRSAEMKNLTKAAVGQPARTSGAKGAAAAPEPAPLVVPRVIAPAAAQIGDMVVAVQTVRQGKTTTPVQGDYIVVTLRITNVAKGPVSYVSWSGPDMGVMFRVERGAFYNQVPLPKQEARSINPNETISDTLVFEPPPALKHLELDLPAPGGKQSFQFRIPFALVERSVFFAGAAAAAAAPKVQAKAKTALAAVPGTGPVDPEKDPEVRNAIHREYQAGARNIKSRSLGMSTNDAATYRRRQGKELLKSIADKHKLDVDQVRRIIGLE